MDYLKENGSWLILIVSVVCIAIVTLWKEQNQPDGSENDEGKKKLRKKLTWANIILMIFAIAGGIGAMVNTVQDKIDQTIMQNDIDTTKRNVDTTKTFAQLSAKLTKQIDSFQHLHIKLDSSTNKFTQEGNELTEQNLASTKNINELTENVQNLLDKLYDEQTTGNSIPLVIASTEKDEIPPPESSFWEWSRTIPTGMYLHNLDLVNTGNFKLTDVIVSTTKRVGLKDQDTDTTFTGNLLPKKSFRLFRDPMCKLTPQLDSTELNYYYVPHYNPNSDDGDQITITVEWRTIIYEYKYNIKGGGTRNLFVDGSYFYKGQAYDQIGLISEILKDKDEEKKGIKKRRP